MGVIICLVFSVGLKPVATPVVAKVPHIDELADIFLEASEGNNGAVIPGILAVVKACGLEPNE